MSDDYSGRFDVLVVDPPWSYGHKDWKNRAAEAHYPTVGDGDGKRLTMKGVQNIVDIVPVGEWAKPNAHLYLWTTNPKLPFTFAIMESWGFTYKTTLTWVKTTENGSVHGGGMGWFYRGATEHVLFGVKGDKPIPSGIRRPNVVMAQPTGHSVKPNEFYTMMDALYPDEAKIDIFARRARRGWTVWGNQAPTDEADAKVSELDEFFSLI